MKTRKAKLALGVLSIILVGMTFAILYLSRQPDPVQAEVPAKPTVPPLPDPPGYRIVYLSAKGNVPSDSPMAPSQLSDALGAQAVDSWDQVIELNNISPIEALVIHESALGLVDPGWVSDAYRQGVVIAVFNVYGQKLAELVGDPCIASDGFASEKETGPFFAVVSHLVLAENPEDAVLIENARSIQCSDDAEPVEGIKGLVGGYSGRTTDTLNNDNDFNGFAHALVRHLDSIQQAKQEFTEGELTQP